MKSRASYSCLKVLMEFKKFPQKAIYKLDNWKEPSRQMELGTALEAFINGDVDEIIEVYDGPITKVTRSTKAFKEWKADANPDIILMLPDEYEQEKDNAQKIMDLVPPISKLEQQYHFEFEHGAHKVHGYMDYIYHDRSIIYELKRGNIEIFEKNIGNFMYALQAYIYKTAMPDYDFQWWVFDPEIEHLFKKKPDQKVLETGHGYFIEAMELFDQYKKGRLHENESEYVTIGKWFHERYGYVYKKQGF